MDTMLDLLKNKQNVYQLKIILTKEFMHAGIRYQALKMIYELGMTLGALGIICFD